MSCASGLTVTPPHHVAVADTTTTAMISTTTSIDNIDNFNFNNINCTSKGNSSGSCGGSSGSVICPIVMSQCPAMRFANLTAKDVWDVKDSSEFCSFINRVSDAAILIDERQTIVLCNARVLAVFGYAPEQLLGRNLSVLLPPTVVHHHSAWVRHFFSSTKGGSRDMGTPLQITGVRRDRSIVPLDIKLDTIRFAVPLPPLVMSGRVYALSLIRDISTLYNTKVEMEKYLRVTNHDLRTSLHAVSAATSLLKESVLDDAQAEAVDILEAGVSYMQSITSSVLDLGRIQSGRMELELLPFTVRDLVRNMYVLNAVIAQQRQITFTVSIHRDVPQRVVADPTRLAQILQNLVSNALKFCNTRGRVAINVRTKSGYESSHIASPSTSPPSSSATNSPILLATCLASSSSNTSSSSFSFPPTTSSSSSSSRSNSVMNTPSSSSSFIPSCPSNSTLRTHTTQCRSRVSGSSSEEGDLPTRSASPLSSTPSQLGRPPIISPLKYHHQLFSHHLHALPPSASSSSSSSSSNSGSSDGYSTERRERAAEGMQLIVDVMDTGIGMTELELSKLFSVYTQATRSTLRQYGGSGLGLVFARSFAELMGGHLTVKSHQVHAVAPPSNSDTNNTNTNTNTNTAAPTFSFTVSSSSSSSPSSQSFDASLPLDDATPIHTTTTLPTSTTTNTTTTTTYGSPKVDLSSTLVEASSLSLLSLASSSRLTSESTPPLSSTSSICEVLPSPSAVCSTTAISLSPNTASNSHLSSPTSTSSSIAYRQRSLSLPPNCVLSNASVGSSPFESAETSPSLVTFSLSAPSSHSPRTSSPSIQSSSILTSSSTAINGAAAAAAKAAVETATATGTRRLGALSVKSPTQFCQLIEDAEHVNDANTEWASGCWSTIFTCEVFVKPVRDPPLHHLLAFDENVRHDENACPNTHPTLPTAASPTAPTTVIIRPSSLSSSFSSSFSCSQASSSSTAAAAAATAASCPSSSSSSSSSVSSLNGPASSASLLSLPIHSSYRAFLSLQGCSPEYKRSLVSLLMSDDNRRRRQEFRLLVADDNNTNLKLLVHLLHKKDFRSIDIAMNGLEVVTKVKRVMLQHDCGIGFDKQKKQKKKGRADGDEDGDGQRDAEGEGEGEGQTEVATAGGEGGACYQLMIVDYDMPVMTGPQALERLRCDYQCHIPAVALTAMATMENLNECERAGMNGFLLKPLQIHDLLFYISFFMFVSHCTQPSSTGSSTSRTSTHECQTISHSQQISDRG